MWAFLDAHYPQAPHTRLVGHTPASVFRAQPGSPDGLDEKASADALTVRVRRDTTVALGGVDDELAAGRLVGGRVFI